MTHYRKTLVVAVLTATLLYIDAVAQVSEQDSLVLVLLYNATDGPNWSRNHDWLTGPVQDWEGISLSPGRRRVTHVDLSSNALTGELPWQIGYVSDLESLNLSDNKLRGNITAEIRRLQELKVLRLSDNQLSGEIPSALRNLNKLEILALENNLLSGPLPNERFESLEQLTLQNNLLSGSILIDSWNFSDIKVLNLGNNQLTGELPRDLVNLLQLTTLKINNNSGLTGSLPPILTNLKNLTTFWFEGTELCEPSYSGFQYWMSGISDLRRSGCVFDIPAEFVTGSCSRSLGEAHLDINNVRARILNTGGLFYRGEPHVYNVPRLTESNAIFAAGLWIAGQVGGAIRASATRYGEWELWAGPIDDEGYPPPVCDLYDRIYKISQEDIERYDSSGELTEDLRDWPTGLGAPTLDANGDSVNLLTRPFGSRHTRTIDLAAGERPNIRGEQMVWWIMNDRGNTHKSTDSIPLGIELHGTAYASRSSIDAINDATLYNYRIFNRSATTIEDAYVGVYLDVDLGDPSDDYVGSDTLRGIGFVYNADNSDEGSQGYGTPPPALGILLLEGPTADDDGIDNNLDGEIDEPNERNRMSHFLHYSDGGGVTETPQTGQDYYNYLRGRWKDGQQFTYGGFGRSFSEIPANFQYPGDPVTSEFWSQMNVDNAGTRASRGDKSFYVSSGPFILEPGEETDFTFSIVWARGADHLDSVNAMKSAADVVKSVFDSGFTDIPPGVPPRETVTLLSPANGMDQQPVDLVLYWTPIEGEEAYQIELISESGIEFFSSSSATLHLDSLETYQIYYWRSRAENIHGFGPWSELFHFTTGERSFTGLLGFSDLLVVQNAAGPVYPPEPAAAEWRGFPVQGRPTEGQQVGEGKWMISTGMSAGCLTNCGDYISFVTRSVESRSSGWSLIYPYDFEIRFTDGGSLHYDRFGNVNGGIVVGDDLPFELWNTGTGTPDDPSDDYRMILAGMDWDGDGWGITTTDHESSGGSNDPQTDWFYWFNPTDTSPGTAGYDAWSAYALAGGDPGESGTDGGFLGPEVLGRMVFYNWNGGRVDMGPPYNQDIPEEGTIFRLETPNELPVPLPASPGYDSRQSPGQISFYWAGVAHDVFRIQAATHTDFSTIVLDSTHVSPGLEWPFIEDGKYFWRVQSATGAWSDIWPFEIVGGATEISELDDNLLPTEFNLFENYPNPFNELTVITYDLPMASTVRLDVYDILGRRVRTLVDLRQAPGRHRQALDATRLTSGVYFYSIHAEGFSSTKMMVLSR